MKSAIKWAATTLARVVHGAGKPPTQQVTYMGKAATVSSWTPYGFDSSAPPGMLALLLAILGNPDNQVALVGSPGDGPVLAAGEVAVYHPTTGSKVHLLVDGSIRVTAGAASALFTSTGGVTITPGDVPLTVNGDLTVTGDLIAGGATLASANIAGTLGAGTCTLGATVTAGGANIGATHTHVGSPTAPAGAISNTGAPV